MPAPVDLPAAQELLHLLELAKRRRRGAGAGAGGGAHMPALPLAHQPANQQHDTATAEVDVVWQSPTAAGLVRRNTDLVAVRFPHELDRFRLDEAGVGVGGKFRWQLVVDDRNARGQLVVLVEKAATTAGQKVGLISILRPFFGKFQTRNSTQLTGAK